MLYKRGTRATSACRPAGPGNVRLSSLHLSTFLSESHTVAAVQLMQNYALTHNLTPFISLQNHLNLVYREEEREMMPVLQVRLLYHP